MALRIEESFDLRAPATTAWRYLGELRELAGCLPGAEVAPQPDGDRWATRLVVRVGPARITYEGAVVVEERDDAACRLRIRADGTDAIDGGTLHVSATIAVDAAGDLACVVHLIADIDVAGRIAQLGPGMVAGVARPLVTQFVACARTTLERHVSDTFGTVTTEESLTLSGAFREHPMLRHTDVEIPSSFGAFVPSPRQATALPALRQSRDVRFFPRLWQATMDRLRHVVAHRGDR